ncbi:hypothetical protein DSM106972_065180 [Dulcicalothrix desertica PCC 7102]|uniref:Uncharacterized protein n=1 Tax=Dulcicalothrix desertica PCC 7102 TaxID=232991 RepID=A0A433V729_9CYAN|nr:hypothetical protein DSM106972_065180 [Dulcicalothrix desertica PCC 7102]
MALAHLFFQSIDIRLCIVSIHNHVSYNNEQNIVGSEIFYNRSVEQEKHFIYTYIYLDVKN